MYNIAAEKLLSRILGFGATLATVLIVSGSVTDPVNTPKMLVIGVVGFSSFILVIAKRPKFSQSSTKLVTILASFFVLSMLSSTLFSEAPFSQILYGSYGRNSGLLTYLFLTQIFFSALFFKSYSSFKTIVVAILAAGFVNLIYCLWVIVFGDFVGWNNPYRNILGTFGNPNFIGAFLGIVFSSCLAIVIDKNSSKWMRLTSLCSIPICALEIVESHAIQGRVVAAFGSAVVVFLYIRSNKSRLLLFGFSLFSLVVGIFSLAGALQMGPLSEYIYKTSVSLRGQYWLAGWNTGKSHPFTGVGMDSLGDWYRQMRDARALDLPGVNTVVNAAHNVPLDIFAFGGWPLFISYICLMGFSFFSIIKIVKRTKSYDSIFAVLTTAWVGYQLQSIISINQIGLAVWGWLLSGTLIAYESFTREAQSSVLKSEATKSRKFTKATQSLPAHVSLFVVLGIIFGLVLALPPLSADIKWRSAQLSRSLPALEASLKPSYFNPPNTMKYLTSVQTLEQSNLLTLSRTYALQAVRWNPNSFDLWKVLYLIRNSTPEEKAIALENMKRLDPLNPDVTSTK